jgi:CRP/FNR family transcriptional regulator, cyclic AMP receptor protein
VAIRELRPETGRLSVDERLAKACGCGFLARMAPALVDELTSSSQAVYYPKGSLSFSGHDEAWAAVVLSGALRYYISNVEGRQLTICYLGVGDLVGDLVGPSAPRRSAPNTPVQAIEPSLLLHLNRVRLEEIARRRPDMAWPLVEELIGRLRLAYRALASIAFTSVKSRVARDLVERARASSAVRPSLHIAVTHQELADAAGTVREVVARAVRELRRDGAIATEPAGVRILDPDALAAAARIDVDAMPV